MLMHRYYTVLAVILPMRISYSILSVLLLISILIFIIITPAIISADSYLFLIPDDVQLHTDLRRQQFSTLLSLIVEFLMLISNFFSKSTHLLFATRRVEIKDN